MGTPELWAAKPVAPSVPPMETSSISPRTEPGGSGAGRGHGRLRRKRDFRGLEGGGVGGGGTLSRTKLWATLPAPAGLTDPACVDRPAALSVYL